MLQVLMPHTRRENVFGKNISVVDESDPNNTSAYSKPIVFKGEIDYLTKAKENIRPTYDLVLQKIEEDLKEIQDEAKEACLLDDEISEIPDKACTDTLSFIQGILIHEIPIPELGSTDDGSLILNWFPKNGTASVLIYGNDLAIYSIYFHEDHRTAGTCKLSDDEIIEGFFITLSKLMNKK